MSNIKKFAVTETSTLHLKDANDDLMYADGADGNPDKNKPMCIKLYGPGSKQYAKVQAASNNKLFTRLKKKARKTSRRKTRRKKVPTSWQPSRIRSRTSATMTSLAKRCTRPCTWTKPSASSLHRSTPI